MVVTECVFCIDLSFRMQQWRGDFRITCNVHFQQHQYRYGTIAIFIADTDTDGVDELYITELANPGVATKLNGPLVAGGQVTDFQIRPLGDCLLYRADQEIDEVFEIYRVDIADPGHTVKMNSPLITGGSVQVATFIVSEGGNELVYLADQDEDDVVELYVVEMILPGVSKKLNPKLPAGVDVLMVDIFPRS